MTTTTVLAGLIGVGLAGSLLLLATGLRPAPQHTRSRPRRQRRALPTKRTLIAVAAGVLAALTTGWVAAGGLAALGVWGLPQVIGRNQDHADTVRRLEAIAGWTEALRDTLSAAAGLEHAILATTTTAPPAMRDHIHTLAARIQRGDPLPTALHRLADDLADPVGDAVIAALLLASRSHARHLATVLGELATDAREQVALRLRIEAGRARSRTSVRVIIATTLAFALGLVLLNRPYLAAYDSGTGQLVLLIVGSLFAAAYVWLARIAKPTPVPRLLDAAVDGEEVDP